MKGKVLFRLSLFPYGLLTGADRFNIIGMCKMKKALSRILGVLVICGVIVCVPMADHRQTFRPISCITGEPAGKAAEIAGFHTTEENRLEMEDIRMQVAYQLARRSVVKVTAKDAAGSGIIWKINDGIVIASSRHLLMKDVVAEVTFLNGDTVKAEILGYSQQYDIGFIRIPESEVTGKILRDIYEVVPVLYETESEADKSAFADQYTGSRVLQIGMDPDKAASLCFAGTINGLLFVPVFNTNVLETQCFSKAGMSGGGAFDERGRLLGMISGGDVPENAEKREAEITYSIPSALIATEYETEVQRIGKTGE